MLMFPILPKYLTKPKRHLIFKTIYLLLYYLTLNKHPTTVKTVYT